MPPGVNPIEVNKYILPFYLPTYLMELFRGAGKDRENIAVDSVLTRRKQRLCRVKSRSADCFHTVLLSALQRVACNTASDITNSVHMHTPFFCGPLMESTNEVTTAWLTVITYRVIQEESALLWEMIVWVILSKKVHTKMGPILNGYGVMGIF